MNSSTAPQQKRSRRWLKRLAWSVAWLVTLLALAIVIENWTGARAWKAYVKNIEASGESLEISSIIPPPIPDEENFAAHPFIKTMAENRPDLDCFKNAILLRYGGEKQKSYVVMDLERLRKRFKSMAGFPQWTEHARKIPASSTGQQSAAAEVFHMLSLFDGELKSLQEACARQGSRFPTVYENLFEGRRVNQTGHYLVIRNLSLFADSRATTALALEHTDEAFQCVMLGFRLTDVLAHEPLLISALSRHISCALTIGSIKEGITRRQWREFELSQFETALSKINFARHYCHAMRGERNLRLLYIDLTKRNHEGFARLRNRFEDKPELAESEMLQWLGKFLPDGWYDHNKISVAAHYENLLKLADPETGRFYRLPFIPNQKTEGAGYWDHSALSRYLPQYAAISRRCAAAQANVAFARIAVALERHHLAHQDYPETLATLSDLFIPEDGLPTDVTDGSPAHYKRISRDHYLLYFNGWNGSDDGGVMDPKGWAYPSNDQKMDWVWSLPEKQN